MPLPPVFLLIDYSGAAQEYSASRAILTIVNHLDPLVKSTTTCNQCCLRFHRLPPSVSNVYPKLFGLHVFDRPNLLVYFLKFAAGILCMDYGAFTLLCRGTHN